MIKTTRSNGTFQTRQYDVKGPLLTQTDVDSQGNVLVDYTFDYDAAGNIVQEQVTPELPLVLPPSVEMTYTAANWLATFNGQAVQFDADGNLLTAPLNGQMSSLQFDSRNMKQCKVAGFEYLIRLEPNLKIKYKNQQGIMSKIIKGNMKWRSYHGTKQ